MFRKLSPQKVQDEDESVVQVASRTKVEYIEPTRTASVDVDFGLSVGVYEKTLTTWSIGGNWVPMTEYERKKVLEKIVSGLKAMGSKVDVC